MLVALMITLLYPSEVPDCRVLANRHNQIPLQLSSLSDLSSFKGAKKSQNVKFKHQIPSHLQPVQISPIDTQNFSILYDLSQPEQN
jgi:hypothetical protein